MLVSEKSSEDDIFFSEWEESYERKENWLLYPKEEVIKFLNKFVRKRLDTNSWIDLDTFDFSKEVRGLDLGCGIGRQTLLMSEFGLKAFGVDISRTAIEFAKKMAKFHENEKCSESLFSVMNGKKLDFDDNFFDITICDSVLDSMHFEIAKELCKEIDRVTKKMLFISVIAADGVEYPEGYIGEKLVGTQHEFGTIQSYFNLEKIKKLTAETSFKIDSLRHVNDKDILTGKNNSRLYAIFQKE